MQSGAQVYSLQLNTYRYILKSEYGFNVSAMYLAVVHPLSPSPRLIEAPRMDEEMRAVHKFEIECGRATESMLGGNPDSAPFSLV